VAVDKYQELLAENMMLRQEIKVARQASDITAAFVVSQFQETEQMLHRFQRVNLERQAVLDAATQLSIIVTDLEGKITLFSKGAANLLGYADHEMVGKENILSLHLKEELDHYGDKVSGILKSHLSDMKVFDQYVKQKLTRAMEWIYICRDGTRLPVSLSIAGLPDAAGRMIGYLFTAMDMTVHKKMEAELIEAKEFAEAANASKGDFLARMSHEIRTPMNGIIGMSYLIQKTELTDKQHNYVEKILSSANTLLKLINNILDFSKIDAGKMELESIPFNLEDVLGNIVNIVGMNTEEKKLEFLFRIDPDVPYHLMGDPLRLGQILMNLAGNAVKFTSMGEIIISASVEERSENGVVLLFSVEDTGIGLGAEEISKLFEAFSQADDTTTRKYGGTGLGLAICKQLIEMMGGRIWVEGNPGRGSKFSFTSHFGISREIQAQDLKSREKLQGFRALVVDDNGASRDVLSSMLSSFNMSVDTAVDGQTALALLDAAVNRSAPYDVVLLDWIMPGIDGIEMARRIRANTAMAEIPALLMVTANGREEARVEARMAGLDAFLVKPVHASVMYNTLLQLLGLDVVSGPRRAVKNTKSLGELKAIKGAHVLLVDDNPINQEVATGFLHDAGMVVTVASSGLESIEAFERNHFDLVLMDIQMPGMDGLETSRRIRKREEFMEVPIVAMTANAMAADREKSLEAGMNDHINKPVDPAILYQVLKRLIPAKHPGTCSPTSLADPVLLKIEEPLNFPDFPPKLPGIDKAEALKRMNNNVALFVKMLNDFYHDYASAPKVLKQLSKNNAWAEVQTMAHTVKGISGYMGARRLFQTASDLEGALKKGGTTTHGTYGKNLIQPFVNSLSEVLTSLAGLRLNPPGVTGEKAVAKTAALDIDVAVSRLERLIDSLDRGEYACEQLFSEIEEILNGHGYDDLLVTIGELIDDIEYSDAADVAQELKEMLDGQGKWS